ncbi:hypothetical protein [Deinococcus marmoris]|uniref:hypothetical protein n=1 Tax=Deinococcus marmoris TaxID=249408 RepID=UPI0004962523|nr:hypothetical protein [Deinococcus marmoris]
MFGSIVIIAGLVLGILALIGLVRGVTPLLKLRGRPLAGGLLLGSIVIMGLGGQLLPNSDVTLTFTPAAAQVELNGEVYTQSPVKVKLTDSSYTVKASAGGYHAQSVEWDTGKQKALRVELKKFTAAELAAQRAAEARKAKEAAAAQARRDEEAAARRATAQAAAEARAAQAARADKELNVGTFVVMCQDAVKDKLKSPSTAKFASSATKIGSVQSNENGNKSWAGWVDSQNSFGAMLRTNFVCSYKLESQKLEAILL